MSAADFRRNLTQHINISEKLSEEVKKIGQDILTFINNLNQDTSDLIVIKAANGIVGGISGVIPDLQELVLKNSIGNENNAVLNNIVQKLGQDCNEMVQQYDSDSNTFKQKFKTFIQSILLEADNLLNIIKKDNLHKFKHELVEILKEIMFAINIGETRMRIENYSQQQLKQLVADVKKNYTEDISVIENYSEDALKSLSIHMKFNMKHNLQVAYHLNKVASNYHNVDLQHKILEAASLLNSATFSTLLFNEEPANPKREITALIQCPLRCWNAVKILFEFDDIELKNKKSAENLRDVARYVISYGMVINRQIGKCVKHDSLLVY